MSNDNATAIASPRQVPSPFSPAEKPFSVPLDTPESKVFSLVIEAVQAGRITPDDAARAIDDYRTAKEAKGRKVRFRRTAAGTLWCGLPYKASKGMSASVCLPRKGWELLLAMAKDGTLEEIIQGWERIPLSAAAKGDAE